MVKRVSMTVFDVLKSLVDDKVAKAPDVIKAGRDATDALPRLEEDLENLRRWEEREAHMGGVKYDEDEETPDDYERKIRRAKEKIRLAAVAQENISLSASFYRTYKLASLSPQIQELTKELQDADAWCEHWKSELNSVDYTDENKDFDDQEADKAHYTLEYQKAYKRKCELQKQLDNLCNGKVR